MSEFRLEEDLRRLDGPVAPDDHFSDELWSRLAGEFKETVSREPDRGRFGRGILVAVLAGIAVLAVIVPVVFFSGDGGGAVGGLETTDRVEKWIEGALDGDFEGIARLTYGTEGEPEALDRLARVIHSHAERYGPPTVAISPFEMEGTFDFTCVRLDFDEVVLVGAMVTRSWPDLGPRLWEFRTNMEGCVGSSVVTTTIESPAARPSTDPSFLDGGPLTPRGNHDVLWTGDEMIVWGGSDRDSGPVLTDGAAYDPDAATWRMLAPAPFDSPLHTRAVWAGETMIVVSAEGVYGYTPDVDAWTRLGDGRRPPFAHGFILWDGPETTDADPSR